MKRKRGNHFEGKTNKQTKTTSNFWTRENNHSVLLSFDLKSHFLLWRKLAGVVPRACWEWSRGSNRQDRVWGVRWKRGESCPFAKGCHLCQCTGLNHVVCLVALLLFCWPNAPKPSAGNARFTLSNVSVQAFIFVQVQVSTQKCLPGDSYQTF